MKQSAFTFVESLIVLFIVGFVTLIGYQQYGNIRDQLTETSFVRQFEEEFLETQKWAIIFDLNTAAGFEEGDFRFYQGGQQVKAILPVPKTVAVQQAPDRLVFIAKSGRSSELAAFVFHLQHQKEVITYQIQMGSAKYVKTVQKIH